MIMQYGEREQPQDTDIEQVAHAPVLYRLCTITGHT
jgi:hypothetical protein